MELVNKIDNKEIYANRSLADSEGNVIKDTYTKKSDFDTWTDEQGHTYVTGLDGKGFNSHWADFAGKDSNGNELAAKMDSWKLGYNEVGKISSYDGVEFAGQGGEGKTYNASTPDYIAVDNDNNTIGLTESPTTLVAGNGLETSTEGDNVTLNVTSAPIAEDASNVHCYGGQINYECSGEKNTGFYVGSYQGNVEVRISNHDNGLTEQWYWDESGIGCRETKNLWGYYSKLTRNDLQFTTDGGYTPSMSFKQLWDEVHGVVLFEGNVAFNNEIPLTESYKNFNKIVIVNGHYRECTLYTSGITNTPNQNGNALFWHTGDNVNADKFLTYLNYSAVNDTTLIATFGTHIRFKNDGTITITTNSSDYNTRTFKVIGYGRRSFGL